MADKLYNSDTPTGRREHFDCDDCGATFLAPFSEGERVEDILDASAIWAWCPICEGTGQHVYGGYGFAHMMQGEQAANDLEATYEATVTHRCKNCSAAVTVSLEHAKKVATAGCPSCGKGPVSRLG